jgi:hypothetical protein
MSVPLGSASETAGLRGPGRRALRARAIMNIHGGGTNPVREATREMMRS